MPNGSAEPARTPTPAPVPGRGRRQRQRAFHFSVGEALSRTFATYFRHFVPFSILAVILYLPLLAWSLHATGEAWGRHASFADFWQAADARSGVVGQILQYLLPWLLQATVTLAVFQYLRKDKVHVLRSLGTGLARFHYVFGVGLVLVLLLLAFGFLIGLLAVAFLTSGMAAGALLVMLLLWIMLLWVTTVFLVAPQTAVVERVGPFKALARSAFLTKGARWKVFGIVLLLGLLQVAFVFILQRMLFQVPETRVEMQTAVVVITMVTAILSVLQAVAAAVIYHDLRKAKEGVGVDELLKVFA